MILQFRFLILLLKYIYFSLQILTAKQNLYIMTDITQFFNSLLAQYGSIDIAENEFKKMIAEDDFLNDEYEEWCHSVGSIEKNGFLDYCEDYMRSQNSVWESLNDFDE